MGRAQPQRLLQHTHPHAHTFINSFIHLTKVKGDCYQPVIVICLVGSNRRIKNTTYHHLPHTPLSEKKKRKKKQKQKKDGKWLFILAEAVTYLSQHLQCHVMPPGSRRRRQTAQWYPTSVHRLRSHPPWAAAARLCCPFNYVVTSPCASVRVARPRLLS